MKKYQIVYKDLEKAIHCQKYQVGDERHCLYSLNKVWLKRFMG